MNASNIVEGKPPEARFSHSMIYFKKYHALLMTGGRNDNRGEIFGDVFLLTLEKLSWVRI